VRVHVPLAEFEPEILERQREGMLALVGEVRNLESRIVERSESERDRFSMRKQLLPRERVAALFDPGMPALELSPLAGLGLQDDDGTTDVMGGALIAQIGFVEGVRVMAICNDSAIKGGATFPWGLRKCLRAQEIALANRLPVVMLVESAGANLNYQAEVFVEGGKRFYNMARLSAAGVPQIAVVYGSSTAGGAYVPGMADYTIMVRGNAHVFLAGPPLLLAATGEVASEEELGGAEMHARVAGTAEFLAENDAQATVIARSVIASLNWPVQPPLGPGGDLPSYPIEDLAAIMPLDAKKPADIREVVARVVDGSRYLEVKPEYGPNMFCAFAEIEGQGVGVIGNNGPIESQEAAKTAQFIHMCTQGMKPIVFLQNTTGFMVGSAAEQSGIIKHGAKMIQAMSNAPVPRITVIVGSSYGAGNFAMCGRAFNPDFIFAWPNSRIAVMGGEQAARVLEIVAERKARRNGHEPDRERLAVQRREVVERFERESAPLFATARLWDDGIIDPRDTRRVLAFCLATCLGGKRTPVQPITFGVSRF